MKGKRKFVSRIMALLLAAVLTAGILPSAAFAAGTAVKETVYVTVSKNGEIVKDKNGAEVARDAITLTGKESYTIDDALKAVHESGYAGGASAGYASETTKYGRSLTKLWGDTSGNFGYQVNSGSVSVMSLDQKLNDGDSVDAYVMQSAYPDSESYSIFDRTSASVNTGETFSLTLKQAGYDANYQMVFSACSDATLTVNGKTSSAVTDADGKASLIFDETGTYVVSAAKSKTTEGGSVPAITAPVCVVTVRSAAEEKRNAIYKETGDSLAKGKLAFGDEWTALGLARSGRSVSESYYDSVVSYVQKNCNSNEQLSSTKSTDNSRTILALTAIGKDPTDVGGHNLIQGLSSFSYLKKQGLNGPIWALIALDSNRYEIPAAAADTDAVTREKLTAYILSKELTDGGWALSGTVSDPDVTAMALLSLAPYASSDAGVKAAEAKALTCLSGMQLSDGGYASYGTENCESAAQVVTALTALDVNPAKDSRFIKNGTSVLDALCGCYAGSGVFAHTKGTGADALATEQAYYALAAYSRFTQGTRSLFDMRQSVRLSGSNRYETAAAVVRKAFPDGSSTVILASGANWPDALASAALAGAKGCPVLLTEKAKLTKKTAELIRTLKTTDVILIGSTASLSEQVEKDLVAQGIAKGKISRIFGANRMQTADGIEAKVMELSKTDTCIIASGNNYPDALSVSAYAYANQTPILLTGRDKKLTAETLAIAKGFKKAIIVGNENAVSADTESQLAGLSVSRYGGNNRYETSALLISSLYGSSIPTVAAVTGKNFPDALTGAALAGQKKGAILLVNGDSAVLSDGQKAIFGKAAAAWVFGSTASVSAEAKTAIDGALS